MIFFWKQNPGNKFQNIGPSSISFSGNKIHGLRTFPFQSLAYVLLESGIFILILAYANFNNHHIAELALYLDIKFLFS